MLQAVGRLYRSGLVLLACCAVATAQQYVISTIAGAAPLSPPNSPPAAMSASVGQPARVTTDSAGNLYFSSLNSVFKVNTAGVLTLVAGTTHAGFSGDGGLAVNAQLNSPQGLAVDSNGNLYIADSVNNRVRVVALGTGIINTFAGNGQTGESLPAQPTSLPSPIYGDGGPPTQAYLHLPSGVAVDILGNVYIADTSHNRVCEVYTTGLLSGIITTIAGDSFAGYGGDVGYPGNPGYPGIAPPYPINAQAILAEFRQPEDVAVDSTFHIYIADTGNNLIREVWPGGSINYVVGNPYPPGTVSTPYYGDGGLAIQAGLVNPFSVAVDSSGNIYEAEPDPMGARVREVSVSTNGTTLNGKLLCPATGTCINSIAGNRPNGYGGDSGAASASTLNMATGVAADAFGNLYIADSLNARVRKIPSVNGASPQINTVAGGGVYSFSGDGGPANGALMNVPEGVALGADGSVYFADSANNRVRRVAPSGVISTIAGNGTAGFSGDNGSGPAAQLSTPEGVAVDALGNVYIADSGNNRVRKVTPAGAISTFAGTGTAGSSGDGGPAASAALSTPFGLTLDAAGNLYITEFSGDRVRKIAAVNGAISGSSTISTVAGNGVGGYSGDGSQAVNAELNGPKAVAVDAAGDIYIADAANNAVRLVTTATGKISTAVGTGAAGFTGDLGLATAAQVTDPTGLALDSAGNLYIADGSTRVRKVYADGIIVTIAGNGSRGFSGDGGVATSAELSGPSGLAVNASGGLYVTDSANNAIRLLTPLAAALSIAAVTNSASNLTGPIAPGEVVTIYGSGLGPAQLAQMQIDPVYNRVSDSLAGTSVLFNGMPAPMVYAWNTQVAAVVPYEVSGPAVQVLVEYQGQTTAPVSVPVAAAAPALFTYNYSGTGAAVALNQDGTLNGSGNAAAIGSDVTLYETGEGQTSPAGTDGLLGSATPPAPVLPVTVTIGGQPAGVVSYGGIPGAVAGVMQIVAKVPSGIAPGNAAVVVTVGAAQTQSGVTLAVGALR
jgi:uncharacterized protein (TIGR03437 family)